jgi:iron complex outermembrane recepter protein
VKDVRFLPPVSNGREVAIFACLAILASAGAAFGQGDVSALSANVLRTLTLDELGNIDVTSVSRREQRSRDTPAAVYVITEEDIRRSGARNLPEALRLVPNLHVARATSRSYAISSRGFSAPFSNKLLVLIDGRTVYSPLFSGVFWDAQDTLLEDVARIEVIGGPGASVWGANAVNGVINIITKRSEDAQGLLVSIGAGTEERLAASTRFGGPIGSDIRYRIYAKTFRSGDTLLPGGEDASDAWRFGQFGGRLDWKKGDDDVTLQGDVYRMKGDQQDTDDLSQSGGNVLARWTRTLTDTGTVQLQAYYDRARQFAPEEFGDTLDTFDVDAQYEGTFGTHNVVFGGGYRLTHDVVENLPGSIAFLPPILNRQLFSAFVQDEIAVFGDTLRLTVGSKLEHHHYTGIELQPTVRLAHARSSQLFWGAVSRAVRTPSRFDRDLFFPAAPPFVFGGGPAFDSEKLTAFEGGWKATREKTLTSVAVFFNDYDDIRSTSVDRPFVTENNVEGWIAGTELTATWQATKTWRLTSSYTLLREQLRVKPGRLDLNDGAGETFDPEHQFQIRSSLNLPRRVELDWWGRFAGEIAGGGRGFQRVPAYFALDARIGWSIRAVNLSMVGHNLLDRRHAEFGTREFRRSVYINATWRS